jgi:two-component system, response regulator
MAENIMLLVEDDPGDEMLTLRALRRNNVGNEVIVVRDGVEALDFLFCTCDYTDRDPNSTPEVIFLDLRLPKVDGLEVLRRMRADERTRLLPVIILTSSNADRDFVTGYAYGTNAFIRKPVDFIQLIGAIRELGLTLLVMNEVP